MQPRAQSRPRFYAQKLHTPQLRAFINPHTLAYRSQLAPLPSSAAQSHSGPAASQMALLVKGFTGN